MKQDQYRLLFLSSLGGVLEFYDFIIYALFAADISSAFFPASNPLTGLLITFATFAIGYLVRPLGGVVFGHFGDRLGRKATFTISILMMALATLSIGLIPPYASIGMAAPILIVSLRVVQGLSIGGEIPGAITYVSESLADRKGLACGIVFCALTMGIVLGSLIQALVTSVLSEGQLQSFGWRLPFIAGGIFGLISYLLRRELHESSQFLAIENAVEKYPVITVFREQAAHVLAGGVIIALCAAIVTSLFLFIPSYFSKVLHLPANAYIWQRTAAITFGSVISLLFGYLSDFYNRKSLVTLMCLSTIILAYPIYLIYVNFPQYYYAAFIASGFLLGFSAGVVPSLLAELFPTKIRYSGIAVAYNLGFAIFGGLTPFISLSLIYYTGWITTPALYLVTVAMMATASIIYVARTAE